MNPSKIKTMLLLALFLVLLAKAGSAAESNNIAVLDFNLENPTPKANERVTGLEDFFEMALQQQGVPVLARRNIRLVLAERNLQDNGQMLAATLSQAKLPSVKFFISGSAAFPSVSKFTLTLSVIRADKSKVESTLIRRGNYPEDWLPAIQTLAKEVKQRLQLPKLEQPERSEFEEMTWIPEAALPFFKALNYFSRGDYAGAVPWFRDSYGKDRHFDIARKWEARAYRKLNLPQLANALTPIKTNHFIVHNKTNRQVVAVIASKRITAAEQATFLQALAGNTQFDLFDSASIGATAREIDLRLTGQMAAPLNDRSVWLVVDDLIFLDVPTPKILVAREQNLLSGEILRTAQIHFVHDNDDTFTALAKAFLKNKKPPAAHSPIGSTEQDLPEPARMEPSETALPKALRLVQADPNNARRWIGLADCYDDHEFKGICLDKAVKAVEQNPRQPDGAYWMTAALWRKREMSRRIFYEPTACYRAPNPLTNDFAPLLKQFPKSAEAASLVEVTNHGEGSYTYVEPADRSYLAAVYTNLQIIVSSPSQTSKKTIAGSKVTNAERWSRLNECLRSGRPAPAWQLANILRTSSDAAAKEQIQSVYDKLLRTVVDERHQYRDFTSAMAAGNSQREWELGHSLLNCVNRRQRAEVIKQCAEVVKKENGGAAQLKFLFAQARLYRDDFLLDPVTGLPGDSVEYQLVDNSTNLVMRVVYGRDYNYEPLMGIVAEIVHNQPPSNLTETILEYIHNDPVLPLEKRLSAAYDLALWKQKQGLTFEAMDQLKDVLRESQGSGLPLNRNHHWSQSIESAAFDALRKIRVYAGTEVDICDCCGKVSDEPPQQPANFEEINRKLARLWEQQIGEGDTNLPSIKEQLLADKDNFFPVILYKLRTGQEVSHTLIFCADLGKHAQPALPVILQIIQRGKPFQDYNNALIALGALGHAAGCAKPLLILARENSDNGNFKYAFYRIGPAPRRVMPQLAQLLYHKDPEICKLAARTIIETATLDRKQFKKLPAEQQVTAVRQWWENTGSTLDWK